MNKKYIVVVLAAGLMAGCTSLFSKVPGVSQITQLAAPRASESDFSFIEDPLLRKHMAAQANALAFRMKMESSGLGATMVQEMQFANNEMRLHSWQEKDGVKSGEMILIGETTYLFDPKDSVWWKQTASLAAQSELESETEEMTEARDFKEEFIEMKDTAVYTSQGQEPCGERTCYKYEQTDSANPESKRTFWFDTSDYLLRRDQSGYGEFSSTSEYSYDSIVIDAPTPTKDVPEGKNIYEYMMMGDVPAMSELERSEYDNAMEQVKQMQQDPTYKDYLPEDFNLDGSYGGEGVEE